jgi:hypothetical protein
MMGNYIAVTVAEGLGIGTFQATSNSNAFACVCVVSESKIEGADDLTSQVTSELVWPAEG